MAGPAPLDGTELADVLDDLVDGSNIHPGIRTIAHGIRAIATDATLDRAALQLLLAQLAGNADGLDVLGALGQLVEHLTTRTPAVQNLDDDSQKTLARQGWLASYHLNDPSLRDPAAAACAALDTAREVNPMRLTDKEKEANKRSENRPR